MTRSVEEIVKDGELKMRSEAIVVKRVVVCFFFNDTATTEIYTLSLHDALPISNRQPQRFGLEGHQGHHQPQRAGIEHIEPMLRRVRSEEHTSELQSH